MPLIAMPAPGDGLSDLGRGQNEVAKMHRPKSLRDLAPSPRILTSRQIFLSCSSSEHMVFLGPLLMPRSHRRTIGLQNCKENNQRERSQSAALVDFDFKLLMDSSYIAHDVRILAQVHLHRHPILDL